MNNKKLFILFIIFQIATSLVHGQVSIGAFGGIGLGKICIDYPGTNLSTDRLTSFTAGIPIEFRVTDLFAIQPELTYVTKGGYSEETDDNETYSDKAKFNYLEIPVYAKFSMGNPKIKFDVFAGLAFAYCLNASTTSTEVINGNETSITEKVNFEDDEINRFDFSLDIGAGTSLSVGSSRLFLNTHYREGITNMSTAEAPDPEDDYSVNNSNFFITFGVLFPVTGPKPKSNTPSPPPSK